MWVHIFTMLFFLNVLNSLFSKLNVQLATNSVWQVNRNQLADNRKWTMKIKAGFSEPL